MCEKAKPHVHADLIKAWADGAIIQILGFDGIWIDIVSNAPLWHETRKYRIKPKPKVKKWRWVFKSAWSGDLIVTKKHYKGVEDFQVSSGEENQLIQKIDSTMIEVEE